MDYPIYYWCILILFLIAAYMIIVDPNVSIFIGLLYKLSKIKAQRFVFWVKLYPRLRYDTAILKWKASRALKTRSKPHLPE